MATAEELLNGLSMSNSEVEGHIVIGIDRKITVPASLKRIAVQYDHNIETVTFDCPRYWDGLDMSNMAIYINYIRSDKYADSYPVTNVTIDDNDPNIMHFDWTISRNVTEANGGLLFLVCIKNTDDEGIEINHWNSEICRDLYVSEGMENEELENLQYTDLVTELLLRMDSIDSIDSIDLYTEEQASLVSKGIFNYFENAKGGTNIELKLEDENWPDWEFTVCGANIVKPLETHTTSGVTFTKRDNGSVKITGTATESSFVPVTELFTNGGINARVSGYGLYIFEEWGDGTPVTSIGLEDCVVSFDSMYSFCLAFKIEEGKTYDTSVYPMVTLGAGKKPFEPYKDYGKVYLPSDVSETTIFTFPEDGDYYIYDSWNWGECPFSCSHYTKKTANYIPEQDRANFITVDELAEAQRTNIASLYSTTSLKTNTVYRKSINKSIAFVLPTYVDTTILNSIELQVTISKYDDISIDLGATKYFGDIPELNNGSYIIYYEHDGTDWCVGALEIVGA